MKRMMRRVAIVATVAAVLVLTSTAGAWALDPSIDINTKLKSANTTLGLNNLWMVIGAVLVIFMQAGFALVETGFCRAKHAAHVVSTNFADLRARVRRRSSSSGSRSCSAASATRATSGSTRR